MRLDATDGQWTPKSDKRGSPEPAVPQNSFIPQNWRVLHNDAYVEFRSKIQLAVVLCCACPVSGHKRNTER